MNNNERTTYNRAIIKLHYNCNNNCIFCHASKNKKYRSDYNQIINKIKFAEELGINQIIFSGGEPTIYPKIKEIIKEINNKYSIGFVTNGRMFIYSDFVKYLVQNNTKYYYISFHSFKKNTHDYITQSQGSWNQTLSGIFNLIKYSEDSEIMINYVLTKYNINDISDTIKLLHSHGIIKFKLSFPEPKGRIIDKRYSDIPDLTVAEKAINNAMKLSESLGVDCYYDGLPYCFIEEKYRKKVNNLERSRIFYMSEVYENDFFRTDEGKRGKNNECLYCSYDEVCEGFYEGYKNKKDYKLRPILEKVPNFISLYKIEERESNKLGFTRINLLSDKKNYCFEQHSDFFKIKNFMNIKNDELIYLNSGIYLDMTNLRKIKENKNNLFEIGRDNFFFNIDNYILDKLKEIKGNVLEVGFGDLFLKDIFFTEIKDRINYYGLDPDKEKYDNAKKIYPDKSFYYSTMEEFIYNENFFDFIVLSGSYAHIKDLDSAFLNIKKLLKRDGKIIIIENKIFAVIFENCTEWLSVDVDTNYEHYRNHSLKKVEEILKNNSFYSNDKFESKVSPFWFVMGNKNA